MVNSNNERRQSQPSFRDDRSDGRGLAAVLIDDSIDRCILFPGDATDEELHTTWICSDVSDLLALSEMR